MGLLSLRAGGRRVKLAAGLALTVALAVTLGTFVVQAKSPSSSSFPGSAVASVALSDLPPQGQEVFERIHEGGPFRYEKDGTVFGNRERLLPNRKRGHYREYTVPTPGLRHRGARRIVCGGARPQAPEACFYTEDHYASFRLIVR